MNILSIPQIGAVAAQAGFQGQDLLTAVAISLAETYPSGNADSYNPETKAGAAPGQGSYGLWQIYLGVHPQFNAASLLDPQYNANAAFSLYQSAGGFRPWSTYTQGQYTGYLSAVTAALAPQASPDQLAQASSDQAIPGTIVAGNPPSIWVMLGIGAVGLALWLQR